MYCVRIYIVCIYYVYVGREAGGVSWRVWLVGMSRRRVYVSYPASRTVFACGPDSVSSWPACLCVCTCLCVCSGLFRKIVFIIIDKL